jgi:hypothetical protein
MVLPCVSISGYGNRKSRHDRPKLREYRSSGENVPIVLNAKSLQVEGFPQYTCTDRANRAD